MQQYACYVLLVLLLQLLQPVLLLLLLVYAKRIKCSATASFCTSKTYLKSYRQSHGCMLPVPMQWGICLSICMSVCLCVSLPVTSNQPQLVVYTMMGLEQAR